MAETTNVNITLDSGLKDEADRIFNEMGMSLTTAIKVFLRKTVRQKKMPFEIFPPDNDFIPVDMRSAMATLEQVWQNSVRNGTDKMTLDEINAEIAAARAELRARENT
jgi:addiction module RelB/DinJ family antitoxin